MSAEAPDDGPVCRICLDSAPLEHLCRPCACRGTQSYVHAQCLRQWQATSTSLSRQSICPVCKAAYSAQFLPKAAKSCDRACAGWLPRWLTLPRLGWASTAFLFVL